MNFIEQSSWRSHSKKFEIFFFLENMINELIYLYFFLVLFLRPAGTIKKKEKFKQMNEWTWDDKETANVREFFSFATKVFSSNFFFQINFLSKFNDTMIAFNIWRLFFSLSPNCSFFIIYRQLLSSYSCILWDHSIRQ